MLVTSFVLLHTVHTCLLLRNFQQCTVRTAFAHASPCTATTIIHYTPGIRMYIYIYVYIHIILPLIHAIGFQ